MLRFLSLRLALLALAAAPLLAQPAIYDIVLKNGRVLDHKNGRDGLFDIAITRDRIARVAPHIPAVQGRRVVDVGGYLVTPGLIDIHGHFDVFGPTLSLNPDHNCLRYGVTTAVDAGTAGWKGFDSFYEKTIKSADTRVLAFLNIVGAGMYGSGPGDVENDVSEMDVEAAVRMVKKYPDTIVGIKTAHYQPADWEAVDRAVRAAEESNSVLMVDFHPKEGRGYRELILEHMKPGNIHTHFYGRLTPQIDENNKVQEYMWQARRRGILFDVGHGSGSLWFRIAVPAIQQGFLPDTISTDIHKSSVMLPRATLINVMSKFLNMGMTVEQVVERVTVNAARAIRRYDLGGLAEGDVADIAVIAVERGEFVFLDSGRAKLVGDRNLRAALTMRAGKVVWDDDGLATEEWSNVGPYSNFKYPPDRPPGVRVERLGGDVFANSRGGAFESPLGLPARKSIGFPRRRGAVRAGRAPVLAAEAEYSERARGRAAARRRVAVPRLHGRRRSASDSSGRGGRHGALPGRFLHVRHPGGGRGGVSLGGAVACLGTSRRQRRRAGLFRLSRS
jgi:dihydroorotase